MLNPGQFERRLRGVSTAAVVGLVAILAALSYWQVYRSDLGEDDQNPRLLSAFVDPMRGRILDREGNVLARSEADGSRVYSDASVAHVLGYIDPRYGSQGAELAFNDVLTGEGTSGWRGAFEAEFGGRTARGEDLQLTIDPRLQAAAARALGSRKGAVVALDPRNGDILAMVSVPTYDPGALGEDGEALLRDEDSPLLNRATQGLYPPGSTFKVVTAASAFESGVITPATRVNCPGEIVVEGFPISCRNTPQGVGTYPFRDAFTFSVNAIFGDVGARLLGWNRLEATAARFGFGTRLDFTTDTARSQLHSSRADRTQVLLATTAFGQGELLATPLQMAVVAAIVANGGVLVQPHVGLNVVDRAGGKRSAETTTSRRVLTPEVARTLNDLMVGVIEAGQASGVAISGVRVAGKTGTAETGRAGVSHAWFIGFAGAGDAQVAVAVIVEDGGQGGSVAAPIAGQVLRAALAR